MEQIDPSARIKNEISVLTEGAELISCTTREEYTVLCKQEDTATAMKAQVEAYWNPSIEKAYALHRELTGKRKAFLDPLEAFIKTCKRIGGGYLSLEQRKEQERLDALRREADRIRAEQEAKIAAEKEAFRLKQVAEAAEQARKAEEFRRKQEAERKAQEEAFKNSPAELAKAKARMEAERQVMLENERIAKARLEAEEQAQREREARQSEEMVDTAMLPSEAPKQSAGAGRALVETWTPRIVDESLIPREYMVPNMVAIKAMVTALKDKTRIPGIEAVKESGIRRTGRQ